MMTMPRAALATWAALALVAPRAPLAAQRAAASATPAAATDSAGAKPGTIDGLALRPIGPAVLSGRIVDLAIHPRQPRTWYIAAASGGVWKTTNAGTTWTPVFDGQASYSIGAITIDPQNPYTIWVGTGENNFQRSVAYGDGVYKSLDGGKSWENVGLKTSEHIGRIVVDPRNSDIVYVAAHGPLWTGGGERGLYKTTDGGKTWNKILGGGEYTGVADVQMDPRNSDILIATTHQRQRRVWGQVAGGPESGLHRSTDGGKTWKKITAGLPTEELGRIGIAISPKDPDVVYAVMEAAGGRGGVFRSNDIGASWTRMSDVSTSGLYYAEVFADPHQVDRIYLVDVYNQVSDDGGRTFRRLGERYKHVDNHVIWIDPTDANHYLVGCDGGLYQSFDRGATWNWFPNLPLGQFYKVAVDNSLPFYRVYGGTQDNASFGGPSRTNVRHGIANHEWAMTVFGDGFSVAVDPTDPNTVYSEWQNGGFVRHDRRTGQNTGIQPQAAPGEAPLRWYWDSPILISPHNSKRIYYAAQRVFRSDDRGDSWRAVSGDLSRNLDRNQLKLMGRVQSADAVARNSSTSYYGAVITLAESPKQEGLLYAGTDDGLVQVTEDGGASWRRIEHFPGVPDTTYAIQVVASKHSAGTAYAVFNNHRSGDFRPYLLRTTDKGRTWTSIAANLPARGSVYTMAEDFVEPNLLFAGTEFGLYVSTDGGGKWSQLKGGLPTIQVRHIAIQERETDLVLATFGRGFWILDDYSPLRSLAAANVASRGDATLLAVRQAPMFIPAEPFMGGDGPGFFGAQYYTAPNPPNGAVFTYWLKDEIKTLKAKRQDREKSLVKKGDDVPFPSWEDLRAEDREEAPAAILTVTDADGRVVRRITCPVKSGFNRVAWDLRWAAPNPPSARPPAADDGDDGGGGPRGPMASPGSYTVSLALRSGGATRLVGSQKFSAEPPPTLEGATARSVAARDFRLKTSRLQRAVLGATALAAEAAARLDGLRQAVEATPMPNDSLARDVRALAARLRELRMSLIGDETRARRAEPTPPTINSRVNEVIQYHWSGTGEPTKTQEASIEVASTAFTPVRNALEQLVERDLRALEERAERAGAPWTSGRVPQWP